MVAVWTKDGWWRGLVLSSPTQNFDEYRVGVTELAKIITAKRCEMRPLPPGFAALPEFGMKGTVISSLVQENELWSTHLQVRSRVAQLRTSQITCFLRYPTTSCAYEKSFILLAVRSLKE